jgi:DNA-binding GntR family transcriptional regulator
LSWEIAMQPSSGVKSSRASRSDNAPGTSDGKDELSSTDRVVNHITAGVLAGRYVPGQRLVEADLTHALRVSRGPVREAFRRLDALGLLSRTLHRGSCVRTLTRTEAIDLMIASDSIDSLTARLAASAVRDRKRSRQLVKLERELRPYRDKEYDLASAPQQRQHFYDILIAMTGNTQLPSLFPTMRIHLLRLQTQSYRNLDDRRSDAEDFAAVAAAVLAGDGRSAEKASAAHHRRVQRALLTMPDEAFPRLDTP